MEVEGISSLVSSIPVEVIAFRPNPPQGDYYPPRLVKIGDYTANYDPQQGKHIVKIEELSSKPWNITQVRGCWIIFARTKVDKKTLVSNTIRIKIDKRQQIVRYAQEFVGRKGSGNLFGGLCNRFTHHVYSHLGLSLGAEITPQWQDCTEADAQPGSLIFLGKIGQGKFDPGHVGIIVDHIGSVDKGRSLVIHLPSGGDIVLREHDDVGEMKKYRGGPWSEVRRRCTKQLKLLDSE